MQPDETDWKIIDLLRKGDCSNSSIARALDVSEGIVRRRVDRLKQAGIVSIRAQIDPDVLENQQVAVIGVTVSASRLLETKAEEIAALPDVLSVSIVSGRYDLLVEVLLDSNHGLVKFLTDGLAHIDGISATESFLLLKGFNKLV